MKNRSYIASCAGTSKVWSKRAYETVSWHFTVNGIRPTLWTWFYTVISLCRSSKNGQSAFSPALKIRMWQFQIFRNLSYHLTAKTWVKLSDISLWKTRTNLSYTGFCLGWVRNGKPTHWDTSHISSGTKAKTPSSATWKRRIMRWIWVLVVAQISMRHS